MKTKTVTVELGARSYAIDIGQGLLAQTGQYLGRLATKQAVIITDQNVEPLYAAAIQDSLQQSGVILKGIVTVAAGEGSKNFATFQSVCEQVLGFGIDRQTMVIALGGGVIGDLAGFAAASILRGLPFIQVPTSLLAMVDSSVGGKTGINTPQGKNLVGAFYQPKAVIIDIDTLQTLSPREMRAGYAEIIKYGLIKDPDFFAWCEAHGKKLLNKDIIALQHAIEISCHSKAQIVGTDEFEESGERALLNLGHTFGHAYEALCGYSDKLLHGEAVALGLIQAAKLSQIMGLCDETVVQRIHTHLQNTGLPTDPKLFGNFSAADVLACMQRDKKTTDGQLNFILLNKIGSAQMVKNVPTDLVRTVLN